jgi:hypothetical protein
MRVAFDTTVLWGAFHRPAGPNFALLALAYAGLVGRCGAEKFWLGVSRLRGPVG